jgi:hypothetical protein
MGEAGDMRLDEAREIVTIWGKYLESGWSDRLRVVFSACIPESFLPFPSKRLETAINVVAKHYHDMGAYEACNVVRDSLGHLVLYGDDDEALKHAAFRFERVEVREVIVANLRGIRRPQA